MEGAGVSPRLLDPQRQLCEKKRAGIAQPVFLRFPPVSPLISERYSQHLFFLVAVQDSICYRSAHFWLINVQCYEQVAGSRRISLRCKGYEESCCHSPLPYQSP